MVKTSLIWRAPRLSLIYGKNNQLNRFHINVVTNFQSEFGVVVRGLQKSLHGSIRAGQYIAFFVWYVAPVFKDCTFEKVLSKGM